MINIARPGMWPTCVLFLRAAVFLTVVVVVLVLLRWGYDLGAAVAASAAIATTAATAARRVIEPAFARTSV